MDRYMTGCLEWGVYGKESDRECVSYVKASDTNLLNEDDLDVRSHCPKRRLLQFASGDNACLTRSVNQCRADCRNLNIHRCNIY